jgi:hypothetical protein
MHHPDTSVYSDQDMLASHGYNPDRLTAVRVWWSEYLVGFEAFYDGISAGSRMGTEFVHGTVYTDFLLGAGEHITEVSGRHGSLIDQLAFKTNKGRSQKFGSSTGGTAFTLSSYGEVVKGFTVGFGGHLHFIGAHFGPQLDPPTKSSIGGKIHGDTASFDDYTTMLDGKNAVRLSEIRVIHDGKMVFGVEGIYEGSGLTISPGAHCGSEMNYSAINQSVALPVGTYITGITGRNGEIIDNLTITLSNGLSYSFGGTGGNAFSNIVPAGKRVVALGGGHGGHLHNIFCYYQ